ncbi:M14 family zinc carboxypeptidase [Streptomyces cavernicola]|uniref:M14 family zinc carboxypeptidase n=1 Tax=Streptomyces cavernicola TaxID=3043613 RepID=A0ABT6SJ86_9ACTN|nr:M14 family zinc carboxypeptidase [Streptomyces sp. B-S-A6]MDI3408260.1 M14 family zinc carboxypeptidase [Streptomyces sp. B-S-A6]
MGIPRPALITLATATAAVLLAPLGASADPGAPRPVRDSGASVADSAAKSPVTAAERALKSATGTGTAGPAARTGGYPREQVLPAQPENPGDKSIKLGLTPYHSIAPALNELQELGDRVSVEVAGESSKGHPLYLVTVTSPESARAAGEQERMRQQIESSPAEAAEDPQIKARYKTPVFVNNNIHGNEWEGTDAALELIEELATSKSEETEQLLDTSRVYFNVTANPDGRIAGTRANGNGFDLNRDFVTASQPETRAMRQIAIDKQPAVMIDLHGYVNGTLIEPTTPPHGENYEYDLFLKNTYANALGMEKAVNGLGYTEAKDGVKPAVIPFRDQEEGWDDWPPIFTPQYMPFHGAVASHTIEFPMRVNNADYDSLPVDELRRRSGINVDIAGAAMRATLDFARTKRSSLIADQIETFRRADAGEKQVEVSEETVPGVPGIGPEDVYTTEFPRAYVIPAGDGERTDAATARLVNHLLDNDVRVERASEAFRLDGRAYPAGSYVVDLHQSKRGMANVLLAEGRDISDKVSTMYDISGWSLGLLWGAQVRAVPEGTDLDVRRSAVRGAVAGDAGAGLDSPEAVAAANAQQPTKVAAAVTPGELFALREMKFDVTPVSTAALNDGFDWEGTDALFVSSGLAHDKLNASAKKALDGFLADGGRVVARGATGAAFNDSAKLLDVTAVEGNEAANGVVRVSNEGPLAEGAPAHSFVYSPMWFTGLGSGVRVEQSYASGNPLVAGHWRAAENGKGGPGDASGRASVVSGRAGGAEVVLFGTEPMFRVHPKGLFPQVGRALIG